MQSGGGAFIRGLVAEEINCLVAEAIATGAKVSVAECAAKVRLRYPACDLTDEQLAAEVMLAATAVGVTLHPGPENA
jgi:hypothetical protein